MNESEDTKSGIKPLEEEYRNAQRYMEMQRETMHRFSLEGQKIIRLISIYIAAIMTALVTLGPSQASQLVNLSQDIIQVGDLGITTFHISVLVLFLLVSALILNTLASAFEAVGLVTFGTEDDIKELLNKPQAPSDRDYFVRRLERYRDNIKRNNRTIETFDWLLGVGKVLITSAIFIVAFTIISLIFGPVPGYLVIPILLLVLLGTYSLNRKLPDNYNTPGI
jgi:hypothetical protein